MFDNLVESSSHKDDLARKGSFFLGTMAAYAVLLLAAAIGSVYLYDAQLSNENLELTTLVAPVPIPPQVQQEQPKDQPKPQKTDDRQVATRTEPLQRMTETPIVPKTISTKASTTPPRPMGSYAIGKTNTDVAPGASSAPVGLGTGGGRVGPSKTEALEPPPEAAPKATPVPTPKPKPPSVVSGGVLNSKAISKPSPPYPAIAKLSKQQGTVTVQITLDESGKVVSATAVNGPPLLRQAAVQAAYQARFSPTLLSGQPVKVSGTITYNFTLQ